MTTSWTQSDVEALEAAIKTGTLRVRFENREVQYQTISEMLKLLETMQSAVDMAGSGSSIRSTYASFTKD